MIHCEFASKSSRQRPRAKSILYATSSLIILLCIGCHSKQTPSISPVSSPEDADASLVESENDSPADTDPKPEQFDNVPDSTPDAKLDVVTTDSGLVPYRVFLPTARGPLLADLRIQIGQRSLEETYEETLDTIFAEAASEENVPPTWEEVTDLFEADPSRFGEIMVSTDEQRKELINSWDRNRDGKVQRDELARAAFRSAYSSREFSLQGTDYYRGSGNSSATFVAIDKDSNRRLEASEVSNASFRLLTLDRNVDGKISLLETQFSMGTQGSRMEELQDDAWRPNRSTRDASVAMDLHAYIDWAPVSYNLTAFSKIPALGEMLSAPSRLLKELDTNSNGRIDATEAKGLTEMSPDFTMDIRLPLKSGEEAVIESLFLSPHQTSCVANQIGANTAVLQSPGLRVVITIDDHFERDAIWNGQVRCRAAEVPDPLFAWIDENFDGVLSSREIANASERLSEFQDADLDSTAVPITYMLVVHRGGPQEITSEFGMTKQISSSVVSQSPKWFQDLDCNRDGEITYDEFIGTAQQFAELDRDGDQFLTLDECLQQ